MNELYRYQPPVPGLGGFSTMSNRGASISQGWRSLYPTLSNQSQRHTFGYERPHVSGAVNLWAGYYKKKKKGSTIPELPAIISKGTPSFEFNAFFRDCLAGYYVVVWQVAFLENFSIPNGLRFQVSVNYGAEEDTTGSFDVILSGKELKGLGNAGVFDLELEQLVLVQPYQQDDKSKDKQWTTVVVTMSNGEGDNVEHFGLQVNHVELIPFTGSKDDQFPVSTSVPGRDVQKQLVKRTAEPKSTFDAKSTIPISRLAWSKDGASLASLALSADTAYITVWDMKHWDPEDTSTNGECSVTTIKHPQGNLKDLSIGLAISSDGSRIAVYQEPRIGQWTDGSMLDNSEFHFRLLLQTKRSVIKPTHGVAVDIDLSGLDLLDTYSGNHLSRDDNSDSTPPLLGENNDQMNEFHVEDNLQHPTLKGFIGYGSFLTDTRSSDIVRPEDGNVDPPDYSTQPTPFKGWFAACNGIYIDIFKIKPGLMWRHTHSIKLTDLTPTISRRITCKLMMDQISRNRFMWLEDGGVCCSIWDLQNGSNISYVSSSDNTILGCSTFRGNSTMSISPDESMVALASVDGVLTTFYASTGIAISSKKFKDEQIEYVSFNGQNNQLFVITRDTTTLKLESRILDPVRLNSGIPANQVPVPVISRTIPVFFCNGSLKNKGFIFEADRCNIRCYVMHDPVDIVVKGSDNMVGTDEVFYPPQNNLKAGTENARKSGPQERAANRPHSEELKEPPKQSMDGPEEKAVKESQEEAMHEHQERSMEGLKKNKQYEVRIAAGIKLTRDDDDSMCWILRVEVVERYPERVVFSFVPEPWMRISAADVSQPEDLLKVYFLPGQKRFVVAGIQTLQIWSLPVNENEHFNLVFIWSRPKMRIDLEKRNGKAVNDQTVDEKPNFNQEKPDSAAADKKPKDKVTEQKKKPAASQGKSDTRNAPRQEKPGENSVTGKGKSDGETTINEDDKKSDIDPRKLDGTAAMKQGETETKKPIITREKDRKGKASRNPDGKDIETEPVGAYYHYIWRLHIFLDRNTGEAEAHIKLKGGSGSDIVRIPGEQSGDFRSIFLNCARSIHLLAASYAYSIQESERFKKNLDKSSLTFRDHADTIARFVRGHLNRLLPCIFFFPLIEEITTGASHSKSHAPTANPTPTDGQMAPPLQEPKGKKNDTAPPRELLKALKHASPIDQKSLVTHSSQPYLSTAAFEVQLEKLATFMDARREKPRVPKDESTSLNGIFTVLTLLLDQEDLKDANHLFIEGLFDTEGHEWTPHPSMALNPIERVIDIKNERLLKLLIDHCIKNAKKHHPGYLTPVIQCLGKLSSGGYTEIMCDLSRKASHIPARNPEYVVSHAVIANLRFLDRVNSLARYLTFGASKGKLSRFIKSSDIDDYKAPVFSVRSQLPFYSRSRVSAVVGIETMFGRRLTPFPQRENTERAQPQSRKIYVSPFRFKPINGPDGRRERSFLAQIAGSDIFDSPAMEASLWFIWNKSGLYFWSAHFVVLFVFFISVLTITGRQIKVSKLPEDGIKPTSDEIAARYLPGWQPAFYLTIAIGLLLITYEIMQMRFSAKKYFTSLFNYLHLAAYLSPIIGCFIFLQAKPGIREDTGIDGGPSQVWILAFGILLIYLNIIFELRIIAPLGRAVNIIINITKKIIWFLFIFAVFLMSFTHALLYVLHTRRYRECQKGAPNDPCKDTDYPSKYPTNFFEALSTTYFFLSGRYGPVEDSFDNGTVGFRIMMAVFFLFTVILLLNVLIALMNDAFNTSETEGERAYWKLLSEVIAEMEMVTMHSEKVGMGDSHSEYIYYCASDEDIRKFQSRSEISSLAESSQEGHKKTHADQHRIINSISQVKGEIDDLRANFTYPRAPDGSKQMIAGHGELLGRPCGHGELKQGIKELRELVKSPESHEELRREIAELRELVMSTRDDGEVKQELVELRGLVKDLVLQLKSNNTAT